MKKIIIILFFLYLNSNYVNAIEPDVFVQSTVNRASHILSKSISKEKENGEIKKGSQRNSRH